MTSNSTPRPSKDPRKSRFSYSALIAFSFCFGFWALALAKAAQSIDWRIEATYLIFVSLMTPTLYWRDKRKAQANKWRTPESTLHIAEFLGGWPAAFFAQRLLPHKISKESYQQVYWLIVISHVVVALDFLFGWPIARDLSGLLDAAN